MAGAWRAVIIGAIWLRNLTKGNRVYFWRRKIHFNKKGGKMATAKVLMGALLVLLVINNCVGVRGQMFLPFPGYLNGVLLTVEIIPVASSSETSNKIIPVSQETIPSPHKIFAVEKGMTWLDEEGRIFIRIDAPCATNTLPLGLKVPAFIVGDLEDAKWTSGSRYYPLRLYKIDGKMALASNKGVFEKIKGNRFTVVQYNDSTGKVAWSRYDSCVFIDIQTNRDTSKCLCIRENANTPCPEL